MPDGRSIEKALHRDLKVLSTLITLYCLHRHQEAQKTPVSIKGLDLDAIAGTEVALCTSCHKLLIHAIVKRSICPFEAKPACKHCPDHCYHPEYRERIREVMKFSGRKLVLSGRIDYLFRLLF